MQPSTDLVDLFLSTLPGDGRRSVVFGQRVYYDVTVFVGKSVKQKKGNDSRIIPLIRQVAAPCNCVLGDICQALNTFL